MVKAPIRARVYVCIMKVLFKMQTKMSDSTRTISGIVASGTVWSLSNSL